MAHFLRHYGSLIGMAAIVLFFWVMLPDTFMTARNWLNISQQLAMLIVVAVTMTVVMVMGDFDLSVGAMASLAGVVAAVLFTFGWPVWAAVLAALAVGLLGGLVNGALISLIGILPFVATLATLTMYSGAAFMVSDGKTIFGKAIPEAFAAFAKSGIPIGTVADKPAVLPWLTVLALAITAAVWVVLEQTTYGRRLYAIGGNAEAARLAGVKVAWLRLSGLGFSRVGGGCGCGVDVCLARGFGQPDPRRRADADGDCGGVSGHDRDPRRPAAGAGIACRCGGVGGDGQRSDPVAGRQLCARGDGGRDHPAGGVDQCLGSQGGRAAITPNVSAAPPERV